MGVFLGLIKLPHNTFTGIPHNKYVEIHAGSGLFTASTFTVGDTSGRLFISHFRWNFSIGLQDRVTKTIRSNASQESFQDGAWNAFRHFRNVFIDG